MTRILFAVPIAALVASSPLSSPRSASGAIVGRVDTVQKLHPVARRPNVSDLGMPPHRDEPDRRRSVVFLETAPRGAFEVPEGGRARMDQRNESFVPHVLAITVGTTVDFPNSDQTFHNVFSLSKTRSFDLGRYAAGRSKAVRFDQPGIVRVFCDIHSHMSAFILVFAHRFFAVTDDDGEYRINDVPPGTYTVVVWNELFPSISKLVTVPPEGGQVEAVFTLGPPAM